MKHEEIEQLKLISDSVYYAILRNPEQDVKDKLIKAYNLVRDIIISKHKRYVLTNCLKTFFISDKFNFKDEEEIKSFYIKAVSVERDKVNEGWKVTISDSLEYHEEDRE